MRFVDLFCGVHGFMLPYTALVTSVFLQPTIDKFAAETYEKNWGKPGGFDVNCDIREVIDLMQKWTLFVLVFLVSPLVSPVLKKGFQDQTRVLSSMTSAILQKNIILRFYF